MNVSQEWVTRYTGANVSTADEIDLCGLDQRQKLIFRSQTHTQSPIGDYSDICGTVGAQEEFRRSK